MGTVSSFFVHKMLEQAGPGVDRAAFIRAAGLDDQKPADPARQMPAESYFRFLEALTDIGEGPPDFHVRGCAAVRCEELGAVGLLWKASPDLRGSFRRLDRYINIIVRSPNQYELVDRNNNVQIIHRNNLGTSRGERLSNEARFVTIVAMARESSHDGFAPLEVHYTHDAVGDPAALEAFFRCSVFFNSSFNGLIVSHESLAQPNRLGDRAIERFFADHLDAQLEALSAEDDLESRVRAAISSALAEGVPSMSQIAEHIGMSGRTLQRRLSDRGQSYQALVESVRREIAERLLQRTDYALAEVAFLTGFAEQSAFTRAFKRWAGQTPRAFRLGGRVG